MQKECCELPRSMVILSLSDSGAVQEGVEGVASYSRCIQDDRHVMWSMLTGNEVACSCLYVHSTVDVCYGNVAGRGPCYGSSDLVWANKCHNE